MNPGEHQSSKRRGQDGGWKVHDSAHLLFFTRTPCMNYVITIFLLVSCMNTSTCNLLLYFARFCARSTPKIVNKQLQKKNFARFHNHFTLLTIMGCISLFAGYLVLYSPLIPSSRAAWMGVLPTSLLSFDTTVSAG